MTEFLGTDAGHIADEVTGLTTAAEQVVAAVDTVKNHVTRILGKLGAANRTEAVARARDLGLIL